MTIKQQYMHERRRLQNAARRIAKEGIAVELPAIPKNITRASVNRLQKITPQQLRESGTYTATGAAVDALELRREQNRRRWDAAKRGAETRRQKKQGAGRSDVANYDDLKQLYIRVIDTIMADAESQPWLITEDGFDWLWAFKNAVQGADAKTVADALWEQQNDLYGELWDAIYGGSANDDARATARGRLLAAFSKLGEELEMPPMPDMTTPYEPFNPYEYDDEWGDDDEW